MDTAMITVEPKPVQEYPLGETDPFLQKMKQMNLFQKYPVASRLAYTVYLDLKVVKKWNYITIMEDESQHLCYLSAMYSETKNEEQIIVPIHVNQNLSFQVLHQMVMKLCKDHQPSNQVVPNAEEILLDLEPDQEDTNTTETSAKSKKRQVTAEEKSKREEIANTIDKLSCGSLQVDTTSSVQRVLNIAFIAPDSTITYYRMFSYLIPPKE